jgi:atypical dual specificity phosphatase
LQINTDAKTVSITREIMPNYFSWIILDKLGGMGMPKSIQLPIFEKLNVKNIISCLDASDKILEPKYHSDLQTNIKIHTFIIKDRTPPTIEQMNSMIKIIESGCTLVHCIGGIGRTNTVLAAYLAYNMTQTQLDQTYTSPIKQIELYRPKVILTESQKTFIAEFTKITSNLHFIKTESVPESQLEKSNVSQTLKCPKIIMCVGYPASGKSTFATHIAENYTNILRINQDEMGRTVYNDTFNTNLKNNKTILIDGCNLEKSRRLDFLNSSFGAKAWCVFFDIPLEECAYRIVRRKNHPTIREGGGLQILKSVESKLEPPTLDEGYEKIFLISSESDISIVLQDMGVTKPLIVPNIDSIIKFPRTKHLVNMGSASRDDLLCTKDEQQLFLSNELYVEEKVDGANLGISVMQDDGDFGKSKIRVQNRSHYVSFTDQFKLLGKWVAKHENEILDLLKPGIEILYGEWLYAKHSINYTSLPDHFLAFDIYNAKTNTFVSRCELERRLKNTTITQVPLIMKKKFGNLTEISALINLQSQFYNNKVEGVYVRVCDEVKNTTLKRAKIVRSDFICGDKHWSKNILVVNTLKS